MSIYRRYDLCVTKHIEDNRPHCGTVSVFAGGDSLVIPAGVQKFIESKKSTLKSRMDEVASKTIRDLRIGDLVLGSEATITEQRADLQTQLLQETRERLFGRNVSGWGSVLSVYDELWFFPNQIRFS